MSQAYKFPRSTTRRPRIAWVMHSVYNAKFFLVPHLRMLGEEHDVFLYLHNDAPEILSNLDIPASVVEIPIVRHVDPVADLRALWVLYRALRRDRPDLVHSTTPKGGLIGMLAAFFARVPRRVHTFQGEVWAHFTGPKRWFFRLLDWLVARLATEITVVSRSERDFLRSEGVLRPDQGLVLGSGSICGVDLTRFYPNPERGRRVRSELGFDDSDFVVLYLGRMQRDKGLHVLEDALRLLKARAERRVRLLAVGPDEDGLGVGLERAFGDDVRVLSYTESPEDFIAASDVLVLPSFREGFGMVLIEAAAMGVPTVASRIYGISCAVVDEQTGILFDIGNAEAMSNAMERLVADQDLIKRLGDAGALRVQNEFDQKFVIESFREFYRSQIADGRERKGK